MTIAMTVIVCAHNEADFLPACLHSLLSQTRLPDELLVVDNASKDGTGELARCIPGVRVVNEPRKGLVIARETGRREAQGDVLVYVANSDFHKPRHLYSWKTLVRSEKNWPAIRHALRANVDIALTLFRKDCCAA